MVIIVSLVTYLVAMFLLESVNAQLTYNMLTACNYHHPKEMFVKPNSTVKLVLSLLHPINCSIDFCADEDCNKELEFRINAINLPVDNQSNCLDFLQITWLSSQNSTKWCQESMLPTNRTISTTGRSTVKITNNCSPFDCVYPGSNYSFEMMISEPMVHNHSSLSADNTNSTTFLDNTNSTTFLDNTNSTTFLDNTNSTTFLDNTNSSVPITNSNFNGSFQNSTNEIAILSNVDVCSNWIIAVILLGIAEVVTLNICFVICWVGRKTLCYKRYDVPDEIITLAPIGETTEMDDSQVIRYAETAP